MGERTTLTASDGFTLNAYRATPEGTPRGGVVVIQEVWGINNWVRSVADRFAQHGFLSVAPAMFDRVEFGYESENYQPEQFVVIGELMKKFDHGTAMLDVAAAVEAASEAGKVGITGYCFGGAVSWRADLAPTIPLEMHFGDQDTGIPLEQIEALKARYPDVPIHLYAAGHGFCNSDRPASFNLEACTKASARTLDFFRKHLG